ncbi:helix-turn-helix domain-containing protein [Streptomyces sp. NPDC088925]|uniref:helix-turn-helix domain-containing protein n=1 Tax=Streptomyces sp. NPDC088925 TaxID=3365914 RepID=UPI0037F6D34A
MAHKADAERLATYVRERRDRLGLPRKKAAEQAGMSKDTWFRVETAAPVRAGSYDKLDAPLKWAPGSARAVLMGAEPVLVEASQSGGATVAQRPVEDLDERAREAVQLALIATAGSLTADEIRATSDRALDLLRERGIIP